MSNYNSWTKIEITNNMGGTATIQMSHQYSDDTPLDYGKVTLASGATGPILIANYNEGFLYTGQDYWFITCNVADGPNAGIWASEGSLNDPEKQCTLSSDDNGQTETFTVSSTTFTMNEYSGVCTTDMNFITAEAAAAMTANRKTKKAQKGK